MGRGINIGLVIVLGAAAIFVFLYLTNRLCKPPFNLCFRTNPAANFLSGATPNLTPVEKTQQAGQNIITGVDTTSAAAKFLAGK